MPWRFFDDGRFIFRPSNEKCCGSIWNRRIRFVTLMTSNDPWILIYAHFKNIQNVTNYIKLFKIMKFLSKHILRINLGLVLILSVENNFVQNKISILTFYSLFRKIHTVMRLQGTYVTGTLHGCDSDGPADFGRSDAMEQKPIESSDLEYKTESVSMNHATEFPIPLSSFHDRVHE